MALRADAPRNRRLRTDRPPQAQCKERAAHTAHLFEGVTGLMWSCQGRGGDVSRCPSHSDQPDVIGCQLEAPSRRAVELLASRAPNGC
jgi:hypothetical protein